ncbi:hypothetical protein [Streptomyces sp. NPDC053048]|uniref:hypothetical protein n=1 Tax=Streptomyces sp. NPDC053048 TaxID=3365694 RepID=UPI0037D6A5CC
MSPDGDPPPPPGPAPGPSPDPSPGGRIWSRVWTYWVTGGLAVVLAAFVPVLVKAAPWAEDAPPSPPPAPPPATTTAPPSPVLSTAPTTAAPTLRVSAKINSVVPLGAVTPTVTKLQANITFTGLKGRTGFIRWHTYNNATKLPMSEDSTITSPVLNWDRTDWKPTFIVPTPTVHWQVQVTAYASDGTRLATGHSNFTFSTP